MATRGQSKYMSHLRAKLAPKPQPYVSDTLRQHDAMIEKAKTNAQKGKRGGDCNRTQCQRPHAWWYNKTMRSYYCGDCAGAINESCLFKDHIVSFGSMIYVVPPTSRIEEVTGGHCKFIISTADGTQSSQEHVDFNAAFAAQNAWRNEADLRSDGTPPFHYGELREKMLKLRALIQERYPDEKMVVFL